jgi:predicted Fe-Mo cluster-binding NifX family protein
MVKIAIPVINGELNSHFGHTQEFYVYEIEDNKIIEGKVFNPPRHEPGVYPRWLADMGVTDVIAGGMGHKAISIFNHNKINVFVGVPLKTPDELVNDFLEGTLETGDNVCDH